LEVVYCFLNYAGLDRWVHPHCINGDYSVFVSVNFQPVNSPHDITHLDNGEFRVVDVKVIQEAF